MNLVQIVFSPTGGAGLVPKATKDCIGCGLCAENCPARRWRSKRPAVRERVTSCFFNPQEKKRADTILLCVRLGEEGI